MKDIKNVNKINRKVSFGEFYLERARNIFYIEMELGEIKLLNISQSYLFQVDICLLLLNNYKAKFDKCVDINIGRYFNNAPPSVRKVDINHENINHLLNLHHSLENRKMKYENGSKSLNELKKQMMDIEKSLSDIQKSLIYLIRQELGILNNIVFYQWGKSFNGGLDELDGDTGIFSTVSDTDSIWSEETLDYYNKDRKRKNRNILSCCFFCISRCKKKSKKEIQVVEKLKQPQEKQKNVTNKELIEEQTRPLQTKNMELKKDAGYINHGYNSNCSIEDTRLYSFSEFYKCKMDLLDNIIAQAHTMGGIVHSIVESDMMFDIGRRANRHKSTLSRMYKDHKRSMMYNKFNNSKHLETNLEEIRREVSKCTRIRKIMSSYREKYGRYDLSNKFQLERCCKNLAELLDRDFQNMATILNKEVEFLENIQFVERKKAFKHKNKMKTSDLSI